MVLTTSNDKQAYTEIAKVERTLSAKSILEDCPLIINLKADDKSVIDQIKRIINLFLGISGKELQDFQISVLAGDLYEKFKTDTLEDVILMFKMARQGEFGKIYRGDLLEINSWVPQYLLFKTTERERLLRIPQKVEKVEPTGKKFHELSPELQEKFNSMNKKTPSGFELPPAGKNFLTRVKLMRDLEKEIKNEK